MADVRSILKDMMKQRRVQVAAGFLAIAGIVAWLLGFTPGEYVAATAIVVFAVATIRWIDDEEVIEEEQLHQTSVASAKDAKDAVDTKGVH